MPQISKYPISDAVYSRIFDIFLDTVSDLRGKKKVSDFINSFLTPTEQIMLAKRLAIAFLLAKGYDYRDISTILRVSTGTVSRVAINYKNKQSFSIVVEQMLKKEEIAEFWQDVGKIAADLFSVGGSKSGSWRYLREEIDKKRKAKV